MIALTDHFKLNEFTFSQSAARRGLELSPPPDVIANLKRLCVLILEPVRITLGRPLVITSGWRPEWLNAEIGGAPTSAHLTGRAADIHTVGMTPLTLARFIQNHEFPVDKVILEFGRWVHIQVSEAPEKAPRRQYLTAFVDNGRTVYAEGLNA